MVTGKSSSKSKLARNVTGRPKVFTLCFQFSFALRIKHWIFNQGIDKQKHVRFHHGRFDRDTFHFFRRRFDHALDNLIVNIFHMRTAFACFNTIDKTHLTARRQMSTKKRNAKIVVKEGKLAQNRHRR